MHPNKEPDWSKRRAGDERLVLNLREQLEFMVASAAAYDGGFEGEAKRLATVVRVLVHDTKASRSLLGLLGVKDELRFVDTASPIRPGNLVGTPGLVMLQMGSSTGWIAPLGKLSPPRANLPPKPFNRWWTDVVTELKGGLQLPRKTYILTVANKEGGAHVDPLLDVQYASLTRNNSLGWTFTHDGDVTAMDFNPALASVRQIAYEVELTLRRQLAYLLSAN